PYTRERVLAPIAAELAAEGRPARAEDLARVATLPLPPPERIDELLHDLRDLGVRDILHCAGSLSYFNVRKLQAGNLDLTRPAPGGPAARPGARRPPVRVLVDGLQRGVLRPPDPRDPARRSVQ